MISVSEAHALIANFHRDFGVESVPLLQSTGRILARDVAADRDFPPYHRVTMDGIAVRHGAFAEGRRDFRIAGLQAAGHPQQHLTDEATCIEVMTGALLPLDADAVVPYEDCTLADGVAHVGVEAIKRNQNIHHQGTDEKAGEVVLRRGARVTPASIAVLASVGMNTVLVRRLPCVAICSTGDELVDVDAMPLPHQIRRSNSYMLAAMLAGESIVADLFHLPDDKPGLHAHLADLRQRYDVLIFSGAVSRGKYDFLPDVFNEAGLRTVFHRIAQKPGKPFLFGHFADGPLIFGFPGNPVSTLVCCAIFFLPWLRRSLGVDMPLCSARLAEDFSFTPSLTLHLLVKLKMEDGVLWATPCAGANSGDMISLKTADAILTLPANAKDFHEGEAYPLTMLASFS